MIFEFTIPGDPFGKQRPKFSRFGGHVTVRTPKETVAYENLVKLEFERQCGAVHFPDGSQIRANIRAGYAIPKSASRKKRESMLAGDIRPTKRPDCDNVAKAILDALNGIAYRDDAQVCDIAVGKWYTEQPGVRVILEDTQQGEELHREEDNESMARDECTGISGLPQR